MSYSSALHLVRGVKSRLSHSGVEAEALFEQAGLNEGDGLACDALELSDKLSHLWELVVEKSGDPLIGLKVSTPHRLGWLGVMGHIMLLSPTVQCTIERCHGHSRVGILLPGLHRTVPRQRYDFVWCVLLRTLRCASGRDDAVPVTVEYAFPEPANSAFFENTFGCPVHFNRPHNVMEFSDSDMVAALPNGGMPLQGGGQQLLAQLAEAHPPAFTSRVQEILASLLPKGPPHRDTVADLLAMSERTLQRRLAEEGTSFSAVVDDTRRALARQSLEAGDLSLKMLSFQLGFSEPSAFYRACKRWFGMTPSDLANHGEKHGMVQT